MKILLSLLALSSLTLIGCTSGKCPFAKKSAPAGAAASCCAH